MSLNEFTDLSLKPWMKIGAKSIRVNNQYTLPTTAPVAGANVLVVSPLGVMTFESSEGGSQNAYLSVYQNASNIVLNNNTFTNVIFANPQAQPSILNITWNAATGTATAVVAG